MRVSIFYVLKYFHFSLRLVLCTTNLRYHCALQITQAEADFLKSKYKKLYDSAAAAKVQEQSLNKKLKLLESDIIESKIAIEKARIAETEETRHLQSTGEIRSGLQKELEETESKDTVAKFELFELKRVHEEMTNALNSMNQQNGQIVDPVMEKLQKEVFPAQKSLSNAFFFF